MPEVTLEQALAGIDRRIDNAIAQLTKLKAAPIVLTVCDMVYRPILKTVAVQYNAQEDPEPLRNALMSAFAGGMADMAAAMFAETDIEAATDFMQKSMNELATSMQRELKTRFKEPGSLRDVPPAASPLDG